MKWEYFLLLYGGNWEQDQDELDELGQDGWELVSVCDYVMYLKRPLKEDDEKRN